MNYWLSFTISLDLLVKMTIYGEVAQVYARLIKFIDPLIQKFEKEFFSLVEHIPYYDEIYKPFTTETFTQQQLMNAMSKVEITIKTKVTKEVYKRIKNAQTTITSVVEKMNGIYNENEFGIIHSFFEWFVKELLNDALNQFCNSQVYLNLTKEQKNLFTQDNILCYLLPESKWITTVFLEKLLRYMVYLMEMLNPDLIN